MRSCFVKNELSVSSVEFTVCCCEFYFVLTNIALQMEDAALSKVHGSASVIVFKRILSILIGANKRLVVKAGTVL